MRFLTPWLPIFLSPCLLVSLSAGCSGDKPSGEAEDSQPAAGGDSGPGGDDTEPPDTAADCAALTWNPEPSVTLRTQSEVDAFCQSWNAAAGDLLIDVGGTEDPITELDGVACLCEVGGDLQIYADPAAAAGPPPPHVTGDIELKLLRRVGGDLQLRGLVNLAFLESLRALEEIGGDLVLTGDPDLQVAGLYGLRTLGGTLRAQDLDKLLILRLPLLESAGGLELGAAGDGQTLYFLVELNLDALAQVQGDARVIGARNLARLSAPLLTAVGGELHLEASCALAPAAPLLESVGSLRLVGNCGLADLSGLAGLRRIAGQDETGYSLVLSQNGGLDEAEIAAFQAQLEEAGPGAASIDAASGCEAVIAGYAGEGGVFCE